MHVSESEYCDVGFNFLHKFCDHYFFYRFSGYYKYALTFTSEAYNPPEFQF